MSAADFRMLERGMNVLYSRGCGRSIWCVGTGVPGCYHFSQWRALRSSVNHSCASLVAGLEVWPESHWPGFALRQSDVFQSYAAQ